MSSKSDNSKVGNPLLQHVNYLRSLNLESPRIGNVFLEDQPLLDYTTHIFKFGDKGNKYHKFYEELVRLGNRFSNEYLVAARNAEENQPRLEQFDTYGRRIDKLHLSEGWKEHAKYAA